MKKLITYIWMDNEADDALKFYKKVFGKDFVEGEKSYFVAETPSNKPIGSTLTAEFELFGQRFGLLNGGPEFKPSEAVSFMIECQDQKEIDYYWKALSSNPKAEACGWLKDKYGVSWQVAPKVLDEMIRSKDKRAAKRVMEVMLEMKKLVISELEKAYKGKEVA